MPRQVSFSTTSRKHTPLQTSLQYGGAIDGVPRTINLRDALHAYVEHQIDVVTRRSQYQLSQAEDRAHIVEGLLKRDISMTSFHSKIER